MSAREPLWSALVRALVPLAALLALMVLEDPEGWRQRLEWWRWRVERARWRRWWDSLEPWQQEIVESVHGPQEG